MEHPGALTESDLLSWNWSTHGDSSLSYGDSTSMTNDYCEIIKQISEADYDSGKDSDIGKSEFVEVCEEETQVGHSLLHIPPEESPMNTTMSDKTESTESETECKSSDDGEDIKNEFELAYQEYVVKTSYEENNCTVENTMEFEDEDSDKEEVQNNPEIYNDKDRMLSDLSVTNPKEDKEKDNSIQNNIEPKINADNLVTNKKDIQLNENKTDINKEETENNDKSTENSPSMPSIQCPSKAEDANNSSKKKDKVEPPSGEAVISGPLHVCLSLGSEWKRRYLTIVDDCLYIWTSHR